MLYGTLANVGSVIVGSLLGLLLARFFDKSRRLRKLPDALMKAISLFVVFIGIRGALQTQKFLVVLISLIVGTTIGSLIKLDDLLKKFGDFMERIVDVMRETSVGYDKNSFLETVNVIQDVLSVDKENEEKVFAGFLEFIKVYQDADMVRKDIFMNVFNPITKKYDEEALKVLKEKAHEIVDVVFAEDLMDKNSVKDIYLAEQGIIKEYFEFIRDEKTGEITQNQPNMEVFASARISKYLKS